MYENIKDEMVYHPALRQQCRARDGKHSTTQYRTRLRYTHIIILELFFNYNRKMMRETDEVWALNI